MQPERVIILIDGSNFYFKLKDVDLHRLPFNFSAFCQLLAGNNTLIRCVYHVGEVRTDGTEKSQLLYNKQQKLIAQLRKHGVYYKFGYLLKSKGVFHEKGVDVHLAVDMLVAAYENLCERILLVSSDSDLTPAIEKAQEKGKIVEYVGFSHKISLALARTCKETRLLKKDDLLPLVQAV